MNRREWMKESLDVQKKSNQGIGTTVCNRCSRSPQRQISTMKFFGSQESLLHNEYHPFWPSFRSTSNRGLARLLGLRLDEVSSFCMCRIATDILTRKSDTGVHGVADSRAYCVILHWRFFVVYLCSWLITDLWNFWPVVMVTRSQGTPNFLPQILVPLAFPLQIAW